MVLKQETIEKLRKHAVVLVLQFGSSVVGGEHPGSDVDLGVVLESAPTHGQVPEVYHDIRTVFSKEFLGKELDVVFLHEAPLRIQYRAGQDGVVLYARKAEDYTDFLEHSILSYLDFKPVERELLSSLTSVAA